MIKNTFEERILMGRLPSSQHAARRLVELARRDDLTNGEIAAAIAVDPALTGRVLERANLLPEASSAPLETVAAAIDRLGARELLIAVRDITLITPDGLRRCVGFDYTRFWAGSLARAVAAERIARATGRCAPEAAYTLGLLSDIGRLALASVYPDEYSALLAGEGGRDPVALARLEREHLEIDHGAVTSCLLEHWGLRKSFFRASRLFQDERALSETEDAETLHLVNLLKCARRLAEECIDGRSASPAGGSPSGTAMLRTHLGLSDDDALRVVMEVAQRFRELSKVEEQGTASPEPVAGAGASEPESARRSRGGLRILAVDDDPTSLFLLRRVLQEEGHEVLCASDGAEALRMALENDLQAVVADWMMPRMDGLELCQALRCIQSGRELFFLLLTGRDTEDQIVAAYDAGVDEYVTKPFNSRILLARLRAGASPAPVVLIAGGRDKGIDLEPLAPVVAERAVAAVLIGESGPTLETLFREAGVSHTERATTLEAAVRQADALARAALGDRAGPATVLLSPAAASFDMFEDYAARGRAFKQAVAGLAASRAAGGDR